MQVNAFVPCSTMLITQFCYCFLIWLWQPFLLKKTNESCKILGAHPAMTFLYMAGRPRGFWLCQAPSYDENCHNCHFTNFSWKCVKFPIKTSQFSLKNQKLNLGQIFLAHLKFSIFGYFSCHDGLKNALIYGHSTLFGISSNSLSLLGL